MSKMIVILKENIEFLEADLKRVDIEKMMLKLNTDKLKQLTEKKVIQKMIE